MSSMVAKGGSAYYSYFYCLGRLTGRSDCKEPYVAQGNLEAIVERVYRGLVLAKDQEQCLRVALEQELASEISFSAESLALDRKRRAKADTELDRAVAAYLAGAMDMKLYKSAPGGVVAQDMRTPCLKT
jgi:site-specific DNA recombinase